MSERLLIPQVQYSPEGELTIKGVMDEARSEKSNPRSFDGVIGVKPESLTYFEEQGAAVEQEDSVYTLSIDVRDQLWYALNDPSDSSLSAFTSRLAELFPYKPRDTKDRVIGIDAMHHNGILASVYPQYQKWMNAHGLNEENSRTTLEAMAIPFGADYEKQVKKDFAYGNDQGVEAATSAGSMIYIRHEKFGVYAEDAEKQESRSGRAIWGWTELTTLGACACLGVNGNDREFVPIWDDTKKLYDMTPHNIDTVRQSFSLLLGLGSLAYAASRYEGDEDILDSVEWKNSAS